MNNNSKKLKFRDQFLGSLVEVRDYLGHGDYVEVANKYLTTKEGKQWLEEGIRQDVDRAVREKVRRVGRGTTYNPVIFKLLQQKSEKNKQLLAI
jgi:hypothetical protein